MQEVFEKIIEKLGIRAEKSEKKEMDAEHFEYAQMYKGERIAFGDAIEIVKQEAEKYDNWWIPCSERLPEYGEVVMCSCTNGGITISCITHRGVKPSKSVRFGQHSVIAWQPLPLPYQPQRDCRRPAL